jgi:hypothetical protein
VTQSRSTLGGAIADTGAIIPPQAKACPSASSRHRSIAGGTTQYISVGGPGVSAPDQTPMLGSLLFHPLMSVPRIPGMTDEELLIYVMREAQLILAEDIDRRSRDPEETVTELLSTARMLLRRHGVFASSLDCDRQNKRANGGGRDHACA